MKKTIKKDIFRFNKPLPVKYNPSSVPANASNLLSASLCILIIRKITGKLVTYIKIKGKKKKNNNFYQ